MTPFYGKDRGLGRALINPAIIKSLQDNKKVII